MEHSFWQDRKESFVNLKLWEEERKNKTSMLGKVVIAITENILNRMQTAVVENETFANYLDSLMKIQIEHSQTLVKNANKFLDPMRSTYEVMGSQKQHFIQALKDLDTTHATSIGENATKIRELIKTNIGKNSDLIKQTAEKLQKQFKKQNKAFKEKQKLVDKAYIMLLSHFEKSEDNFRNGEESQLEKDLWFCQYQFLRLAKEGVECLNQLKETLFLIWDHGRDKELTRMQALKELYEGIIGSN